MKNVKKKVSLALFLVMVLSAFSFKAFASTNSYLIVDVFDHYDDNCAAIHELELFDSDNNKINYTVSSTDEFDSARNGISEYWNHFNLWEKAFLNDGSRNYISNSSTLVNWSSTANSEKWTRFVILIDSSKIVSKINIWAGQVRIPKKVSVYKANTYDYNLNIKGRDNTNLTLLGECIIKNTKTIVANEIKVIPVPINLVASAGNSKVELSWNSAIGATSYYIKRATTVGGPYTTIATVSANTYTDTTAVNGNTYYYAVSALDSSNIESANSNEVSTTLSNTEEILEVVSVDKAKVGDEITANIVVHNAVNICAEDIKIAFDTSKLEFISADGANGIKIYKEDDLTDGIRRYITASLGKENAANGDKILLKLTFKAKASGEAKIDITNGRIADNATLEKDIKEENCGEKVILIEGKLMDVNRSGEFTLLDLGINAWYFGDAVENTDTSKYDADVVKNGIIDDDDLTEIVKQMLNNSNYPAATKG